MIREIHLRNFRNYEEEKVIFNSGINLFCGKNGHGKTNLLEAVYFLATLDSFRKAESAQMIRRGEELLTVKGLFYDGHATTLSVEKDLKGWRKISIDGELYRKKSDYIGRIRMVAFSPDEVALIQGSPEERRRYLDRTFFNVHRSHLKDLNVYRRILRQRNILLKRGGWRSRELDAWSERLARAGAVVIRGRMDLLDMLNSELARDYSFMERVRVSLEYRSTCPVDGSMENIEKGILDALRKVRGEEEKRRTTLAGPHRDDVAILIDGHAAKGFSSRGEMRSILLALKSAETELFRKRWGKNPLILLDDVLSELDAGRRKALLGHLRENGKQVLITATEAENIPLPGSEKVGVYRIEKGKVFHRRFVEKRPARVSSAGEQIAGKFV